MYLFCLFFVLRKFIIKEKTDDFVELLLYNHSTTTIT